MLLVFSNLNFSTGRLSVCCNSVFPEWSYQNNFIELFYVSFNEYVQLVFSYFFYPAIRNIMRFHFFKFAHFMLAIGFIEHQQ